jgi:hypothetical protein
VNCKLLCERRPLVRLVRRWGFTGYGSTPLHYPLHPSIDGGGVSVRTPVLWRSPYCHCITDRWGSYAPLQDSRKCSLDWADTCKNLLDTHFVRVPPEIRFIEKRSMSDLRKWWQSLSLFQCTVMYCTRILTRTRTSYTLVFKFIYRFSYYFHHKNFIYFLIIIY